MPGAVVIWAGTGLAVGLAAATVARLIPAESTDPGDKKAKRRRPWVTASYVVAYVGVAFAAASARAGNAGDAAAGMLFGAALMLMASLIGYVLAPITVLVRVCLAALVGFGRILLAGRADGEPASRAAALGPFVAVLGLTWLPVAFVGIFAYDSPRGRDIGPLFGVVRDDVDITHPTLLIIGQVATWICFGGVAMGALIFFAVAGFARRRDSDSASPGGVS